MNWRDWIGNLKFTKKILFYITYTVVLVFALFNLKEIGSWIGHFVGMAYPFLMGVSIAFVVNVLLKFYEERVFAFLNPPKSATGRTVVNSISPQTSSKSKI